jgi:hypothetical protein
MEILVLDRFAELFWLFTAKIVDQEIMRLLEGKAKGKGYKRLVLETGDFLTAANRLYLSSGYKRIPNYGQYKDMPHSVCMEKYI